MSNDTVVVSIVEDDMHFMVEMPRKLNEKMAEIASRYPEGTWSKREMELSMMASEELESEKSKQNPESQSEK